MDEAVRQAKLAALSQELDAIHVANKVYWDRKEHNRQDDMEHQLRQERLEQVRKEMSELGAG
jgi:hypothetical protein